MTRDRAKARAFGLRAETIAAALLLAKGYRILSRGYLAPGGEIDIVAARGPAVAFVEVKARPSIEEAMQAISAVKRARIARAARHWLVRNPWAVTRTLRGDAIYVAPRRWPVHAVDEFELR